MSAGEWGMNQAGIKALYHLEDVNDSGGGGLTLTNNGTVTFSPAKFRNGADMGASNSSKYLSRATNLGITGGAITMALWVKLNTEIAANIYKLAVHTGGLVVYNFGYEYNGGTRQLNFTRGQPGGSDGGFTYPITMGTTQWYWLVFAYDATTLRGYVNGTQVGSVATSGNGSVDVGNKFAIGGTGSGGEYSSAIFDEVLILNQALTYPQIKNYYAWAKGLRTSTP